MQATISKARPVLSCIIIMSLLFLGGCVTAKQKLLDSGMTPLAEADFQTLFAVPLKGDYRSIKQGGIVSTEFLPDGTEKMVSSKISDEGTWRIVNGEQCSKWNNLRGGREACFTWFKVADGVYDIFDASGAKAGTLTVK